MLDAHRFLSLTAEHIEISDILGNLTFMRIFAVYQAEPNRCLINVFETYQIGSFAAAIVIED